jgi:predicted metal-binding membrane protein
LGGLAVLTALTWAYLVHLDREMSAAMQESQSMAEMGMSMDMPWTLTDAVYTFVMWTVMMVAMMTPSAAPVVLLFAGMQRKKSGRHLPVILFVFGAGYLLVWTGFSAAATAAQWALHQTAMLSPGMKTARPWMGGAILIAAGIYQVTPSKRACLAHCQSPLGYLMSHWRNGIAGALRMGIAHGAYCVGCCWALMCVLFVVGVMNLAWIAALSAFVLVEKTGLAGQAIARVAGAGMVVAGILMLIRSI